MPEGAERKNWLNRFIKMLIDILFDDLIYMI